MKETWFEKAKLLLFSVFVIVAIIFILTLLIVGFQTLFGSGAGCGYDLSC